jgi:hypothetical protein
MRRILGGTTAELLVLQNSEKIDAFHMKRTFVLFRPCPSSRRGLGCLDGAATDHGAHPLTLPALSPLTLTRGCSSLLPPPSSQLINQNKQDPLHHRSHSRINLKINTRTNRLRSSVHLPAIVAVVFISEASMAHRMGNKTAGTCVSVDGKQQVREAMQVTCNSLAGELRVVV